MSRRSPGAASAPCRSCSAWRPLAIGPGGGRPRPRGGARPSDPVFTALLIDGTTTSGRIRQLGPEGELVLVPVEGPEQVIPLARLVKLSREGGAPASAPEGAVVLFPDGDRLYGGVVGAADETSLEVQSSTLGDLAIPLESLLGLVLNAPDGGR